MEKNCSRKEATCTQWHSITWWLVVDSGAKMPVFNPQLCRSLLCGFGKINPPLWASAYDAQNIKWGLRKSLPHRPAVRNECLSVSEDLRTASNNTMYHCHWHGWGVLVLTLLRERALSVLPTGNPWPLTRCLAFSRCLGNACWMTEEEFRREGRVPWNMQTGWECCTQCQKQFTASWQIWWKTTLDITYVSRYRQNRKPGRSPSWMWW